MIKLNSKMKILMRILLITVIMIFFILINQVDANSINSIEMDIYIDKNGNAEVTEVWNANLTQGTEGYRPCTNLGESEISNFSVSDKTGKKYKTLSTWNVNASFNSKAYKCGYNYVNGGVELCWGISNYGNNTYTLKYNISNFVTQYTDKQGIYTNLLNLEQRISHAKIIIHSDYDFSLDNARIWAFGNNGTINFVDGNIVLDSDGVLSPSQYMVALVRFENNLFKLNNKSNKSFNNIYDSAMSDVTDEDYINSKKNETINDDNENNSFTLLLSIILFPLGIVLNPMFWILLIIIKGRSNSGYQKRTGQLEFGDNGKKLPPDDEIEYWREIPCNKDLERAYWVAYQYDLVDYPILKRGIIGAILLKWIKEGKITVSKTRKGLFSFKDNNYAINFNNMSMADNKIENDLLEILKSASGGNGILEAKEFEKWCKKKYYKLDLWFVTFVTEEQKELEKQGLITSVTEEIQNTKGKTKIITVKKVGNELYDDALHLKGLKKFLLEYSLMPEREFIEVHVWEEYLIFAQLLGIADKVEEQFSKLYPKFNEQSSLNMDVTTVVIRGMVDIGIDSMELTRQKINERARLRADSSSDYDFSGNDRDSGGGGRSYRSGGGSAGGSSGGGFR